MLQFSDAHGLNSPCVDRTDNGINLLKIGQPDIQLLTYQKFLSSLAPIIPYFLCTDSIIRYSDFEKINEEIEDVDAKYKNPRNLCSGSVRQLNNEITARRNVRFYAFTLVSADGVDFHNSRARQFEWLKEQGFDVVEYRTVTASTLDEAMEYFSTAITENDFPSDGNITFSLCIKSKVSKCFPL